MLYFVVVGDRTFIGSASCCEAYRVFFEQSASLATKDACLELYDAPGEQEARHCSQPTTLGLPIKALTFEEILKDARARGWMQGDMWVGEAVVA